MSQGLGTISEAGHGGSLIPAWGLSVGPGPAHLS